MDDPGVAARDVGLVRSAEGVASPSVHRLAAWSASADPQRTVELELRLDALAARCRYQQEELRRCAYASETSDRISAQYDIVAAKCRQQEEEIRRLSATAEAYAQLSKDYELLVAGRERADQLLDGLHEELQRLKREVSASGQGEPSTELEALREEREEALRREAEQAARVTQLESEVKRLRSVIMQLASVHANEAA